MLSRFTIAECTRAVISAVGLNPDDELQLWRAACPSGCAGDEFTMIEFNPAGCTTLVTQMSNPIMIDVPGTYELRFVGAINPDVEVCVDTYARNCHLA